MTLTRVRTNQSAQSVKVPEATAAQRSERMLTLTAVLFRATGILQVLITVLSHSAQYARPGWVLTVALTVCLESVLLSVYWLRRRKITPVTMSADIALCVAALAANAALTDTQDALTWAYFMYGFTILTSIGIGVAYLRYVAVLAATTALAAGYVLSSLFFGLERPWNALPDTISYFADTSVTWIVARELRRSAGELDTTRAKAVADAAALATERERLRHARALHDRVLQTMETLARGHWIADDRLRAQVAGEATWLRALVRGDPIDHEHDLLTALQAVVCRKTEHGLDVQLVDGSLRQQDAVRAGLAAASVAALSGAVEEALTNVAKHAGVDRAVLHAAATPTQVTISIVDHGRGFDPAHQPVGWGLPQSIRRRLLEIGGHVHLESAPGAGTSVELTLDITNQGNDQSLPTS
ncbi:MULTISPECIES: sensor histidine kinase [unclassified Streptomyces]|uniref:sensor histidine kinase n=1 Tax=unclassified Streptomyces TaxID=2593676 RepID=UPI0022570B9D|nr:MULTISPECIES: ATP-binding protein [unclassified Streptomyces]MCX5063877.1 ATP-binding protein [Streptomyces sp. NBC_00452]